MPASAVLFVRIQAPPLSRRKLRAVLPSLLSTRLPFPVGDCVALYGGRSADGFVPANVVRKGDLSAFLAAPRSGSGASEPERVVAPGPALWRWACAMQPLPANSVRAVVHFDKGRGESLVAAGVGDELRSVVPFRGGADAAALNLSVALAGIGVSDQPPALMLTGSGADELRVALQGENLVSMAVPDAPETALDRALGGPGIGDLDFRVGEFADSGVAASALRPLRAASIVFFAAAALWAVASDQSARAAERELADVRRQRDEALETLAGRRLATRGASALAEASEAARMRRDPAVPAPDAIAWLRPALSAARSTGVRFSHLELRGNALSASGESPTPEAARAFADAAAAAGLRTKLAEAPVSVSGDGGGFAFYVHPGTENQAE